MLGAADTAKTAGAQLWACSERLSSMRGCRGPPKQRIDWLVTALAVAHPIVADAELRRLLCEGVAANRNRHAPFLWNIELLSLVGLSTSSPAKIGNGRSTGTDLKQGFNCLPPHKRVRITG